MTVTPRMNDMEYPFHTHVKKCPAGFEITGTGNTQ